jgi:hypothetical protein
MGEDQPLSQNLQDHYAAIESEFKISHEGTSDEIASRALTKLSQLIPEATEELISIVRNGDKEDAVRLQAIKLVFEYTLGKPVPKSTNESDIDKIISSLKSSPAPVQ